MITWAPLDKPDDMRAKEIPGDTETEGIDRIVKILIESLHPGVEYHFKITTKSHDLSSNTVTKIIRTQPLCTSEIFIINNQEVSTALTLRYTPTPLQKSTVDAYRFMLSDLDIPVKEKAAADQDRKVTFVDLMPGQLYNITLCHKPTIRTAGPPSSPASG